MGKITWNREKWRRRMAWLEEVVKLIGLFAVLMLFILFAMYQFGLVHFIGR